MWTMLNLKSRFCFTILVYHYLLQQIVSGIDGIRFRAPKLIFEFVYVMHVSALQAVV